MAFSSVPQNSEEGRAFLQERLALFGKSAFLLFAAMAGIGFTVVFATAPAGAPALLSRPYHVLGIAGLGVAWLVCRRGTRSARMLAALDAAITILSAACVAGTLFVGRPEILPGVPATLGVTYILFARAIVVPSDWRRTLWIGVLAALPTIVLVAVLGADGVGSWPEARMMPVWSALLPAWCVLAVGMSTWTSHVIYRLRRRVVEARQLGQYTLEDKIGEGGMGVVYRARHAMLRRPTVIKLLPPEKTGADNLARFEREVQHTSLLSSPNTVAVYDYGRTPDGVFYYAMELLDGIDLDKLVEQAGPLPASRVIHILAQAANALAEAHEAGLIHRDIKPGNIMLCRHGGAFDVVKVLDFGLVKDLTAPANMKLTQAETLLGTPLYMSPESITEPEALDGRADLYALGAVGYFLLTGEHVFTGRTLAELCTHHLHIEPEPPSRRRPGVPPDLEAVILACLAKDRAQRPRDARALRRALLACESAGLWSEDDARAWWNRQGPREARAAVSG